MRFAWLNSQFLFFLGVWKAQYFVDRLHSRCPSSPGLCPIFGRFTGRHYGDFAFLGHLWERIALDLDGQEFASGWIPGLPREFRVGFRFVNSSWQKTLGNKRIVSLLHKLFSYMVVWLFHFLLFHLQHFRIYSHPLYQDHSCQELTSRAPQKLQCNADLSIANHETHQSQSYKSK